jgi:hypothetical protein
MKGTIHFDSNTLFVLIAIERNVIYMLLASLFHNIILYVHVEFKIYFIHL